MANKIPAPPIKMPSEFYENEETAKFFDALLRSVYQMWEEITKTKSRATTKTSGNTTTVLQRIAIKENRATYIEALVIAHRTGGTAGSNDDSAYYKLQGLFKNISGTIYQVGAIVVDSSEDQAGWNCSFYADGTDVVVSATGAIGNDITWESDVFYNEVGA
jgi:hypothetical protein